MALVWTIGGAGPSADAGRLASELCAVLPRATRVKPSTADDLSALVAWHGAASDHIVVQTDRSADAGDIAIYVEATVEGVDQSRPNADLCIGPASAPDDWSAVLQAKLPSGELRAAVRAVLEAHQKRQRAMAAGLTTVGSVRTSTDGSPPRRAPDLVVVEQVLTIMIEGVGNFAVMCTPCDVEALAVGFAHSEGLISSPDDVIDLTHRPDQNAVALRIESPPAGTPQRNLIVTSSCGLCGSRNIDRLLGGGSGCPDTLRVPPATLHAAVARMQTRQILFGPTGGTHAAGVFSADGGLIAFAEDIGRHNALDKAIGRCLLDGETLAGHGAVLSSRLSFEMVAKAARAGFEIVAAVSAPSSLAIETAEKCGITLCAFVREDRATVYTHPRRIVGLERAG